MEEGLVNTSHNVEGHVLTSRERAELHTKVVEAFSRLDGTSRSAVQLLTGATDEELDELGGFGDEV